MCMWSRFQSPRVGSGAKPAGLCSRRWIYRAFNPLLPYPVTLRRTLSIATPPLPTLLFSRLRYVQPSPFLPFHVSCGSATTFVLLSTCQTTPTVSFAEAASNTNPWTNHSAESSLLTLPHHHSSSQYLAFLACWPLCRFSLSFLLPFSVPRSFLSVMRLLRTAGQATGNVFPIGKTWTEACCL